MAMTHEERLQLLKMAREAKAKKRQERLDNEPPKSKGRPKKMPEPVVEEPVEEPVEEVEEVVEEPPKPKAKPKAKKVLNAPNVPQKSLTLPVAEKLNADDDMEVVQDVITEYQTQVIKKPKKKIVKKIVYESDSEDEIVEEIEYKPSKPKKVVKKEPPKEAQREPPRDMKVNSPTSVANMFFNY